MSNALHLGQEWLDRLLPDGLPVPSSTIISGPGGSGKPLIGAIILAAWLRAGGNALVFQLNADRRSAERLLALYNLNPAEFRNRIIFIDLDPQIDTVDQIQPDMIRANILKPELLRKSIETGQHLLNSSRENVMLYGSALNILFFSHTWGDKIFAEWERLLFHEKEYTSTFSVSTSAFREKIEQLEILADNLMYTRMGKSMAMRFQIVRVKGARFEPIDVTVPLTEETLTSLKTETDRFRKRIIPMVSKI